jgi:NADPH:quinone reductase-like Zn-dependent oxidoreductase
MGGERVGLVPASAFDVDVAFEAHRHVGQQVAEDRHRCQGLAHHGRDLPRPKSDASIDPVGGAVRTHSLDLLAPSGRLIVVGNAGGDWGHQLDSNRLWLGGLTVSGFNAGIYIPAHPEEVGPAAEAALKAVAAGLGETEIDVFPFAEAVIAHQRMESRALNGRIVLTPNGRS